jgi:hypothetical protein
MKNKNKLKSLWTLIILLFLSFHISFSIVRDQPGMFWVFSFNKPSQIDMDNFKLLKPLTGLASYEIRPVI